MPDWFYRLQHSRRARNITLAAIGMLMMGSTGGALLANYTVAGMNRVATSTPPMSMASREQPEWLRDATDSFSPPERQAEYSDASY